MSVFHLNSLMSDHIQTHLGQHIYLTLYVILPLKLAHHMLQHLATVFHIFYWISIALSDVVNTLFHHLISAVFPVLLLFFVASVCPYVIAAIFR